MTPDDWRHRAASPTSARVAVLFHRFGPYHLCRLNAAARQMQVVGIEFSGTDRTYAWSRPDEDAAFPRRVVSDDIEAESRPAMIRKIGLALDEAAPDAVAVAGWSHPAALATLLWCARNRVPAIVMSDSAEHDEIRSAWREWVKRRVVTLFSAGLVAGGLHRRYLARLGMANSAIREGFDVVDNDYFARGAAAARKDSDAIRRQLALPRSYFLASCRFVAKKNLFTLLEAYRGYRAAAGSSAWDLVLLGDGPLAKDLRALVESHGLEGFVHMPGFRQYPELPTYYGLAEAFILPSTTEQWGLVVNEAMAAGLPVLVSERCGCSEDLVDPGANGFRFNPFDPADLANRMLEIAADDCDRIAMGRAAQTRIADWSPERFGRELRQAVERALATPRPATKLARWIAAVLLWRRERTDS